MCGVARHDPFDETLWGEYARMLLVGTAACTGIAWAARLAIEPAAFLMVVANVLVMAIAATTRWEGLPRLTLIVLLLIGGVAALTSDKTTDVSNRSAVFFSPAITLAALLILLWRDGLIAVRKRMVSMTPRTLAIMGTLFGMMVYMVVLPGVDAVLESFREHPNSYTIEDLSPLEILRIRSSELAVFAIFAYAGACVGSFLNVVAASVPKGESIAFRSSACPQCGTLIRRVDNLPIYSYLHLSGRCRDCDAPIPFRYFAVECAGLLIFGSLFLYELVTGGANVPGFPLSMHAGILWIIFYTKWPVVGIYLFHCGLFSVLLMLSLMEQDRLRPPRSMIIALLVVVTGLVVALPNLLTVSLTNQTPLRWPSGLPGWTDRAAASLVGGVVGFLIGHCAKPLRLRARQTVSLLPLGCALLGIALGWQAVVTIALVWSVAWFGLTRFGGPAVRPAWLTGTTLLFFAAMLHHPGWKWLSELMSF